MHAVRQVRWKGWFVPAWSAAGLHLLKQRLRAIFRL